MNNDEQSNQYSQQIPVSEKAKSNLYIAAGVSIALIIIIGIILFFISNSNQEINNSNGNTNTSQTNLLDSPTEESTPGLKWNYVNNEWVANGGVPTCPNPLLKSPVDVNLVTGLAYPGQTRETYKTEGEMNFNSDNTSNNILVNLAMDGVLIKAARYIESGEVQYLLEFMNPCGVILRYDHLLTLTPPFQVIIDTLPESKENDSTVTEIFSNTEYKAGDLIATSIGFKNPSPSAIFEFGVYDLRQPNNASKDIDFIEQHKNSSAVDYYGVCWLNYLPEEDAAILKALPVSGEIGAKSDYCTAE